MMTVLSFCKMKIWVLWLVPIFFLGFVSAVEIVDSAKAIEDWIISLRRELHQIPELEFELPKTSKVIRNVLDQLDISYKYPVARSGIVAKIGSGTPVIGLRADMDALPIQEPPGLSFASRHEGKMHACGHDAHTSMLLGAARMLKEREGTFQGTVKLFFQPAEEVGHGAKEMIKTGQVDGVSVMFGFHVWPSVESGIVMTKPGLMMAGVCAFQVTVTGKGGHASAPNLVKDPMIAVASMISAYQTIISRSMSPIESHVISVTKINGGRVFNVVPDSITFHGTMRSLEPDGIDRLITKFTEVTNSVAASFGCRSEVNIVMRGDPVINDEKITSFATETARELFGEEKVKEAGMSTAAEDFAALGNKVPASFIFLGIKNEDSRVNSTAALHNPYFRVDEDVLHKGAALHTLLALKYLKGELTYPHQKTEL